MYTAPVSPRHSGRAVPAPPPPPPSSDVAARPPSALSSHASFSRSGHDEFVRRWQSIIAEYDFFFTITPDEYAVRREDLQLWPDALVVRHELKHGVFAVLPLIVSLKARPLRPGSHGTPVPIYSEVRVFPRTDPAGFVRVTVKEFDVVGQVQQSLQGIVATVHGHRLLDLLAPSLLFSSPPPLPHRLYGLRDYSVFFTLRGDDRTRSEPFLSHVAHKQRVTETETLWDGTVGIRLSTFPLTIPIALAHVSELEPSRLMLDVTVLTDADVVLFSRTGFVWLQKYAHLDGHYDMSLLIADACHVRMAMHVGPGEQTTFLWAKIILPVQRINAIFRTSHKFWDVQERIFPVPPEPVDR